MVNVLSPDELKSISPVSGIDRNKRIMSPSAESDQQFKLL